MLKKFYTGIEEYVYGVVGGWAHFVGMCIADGFNDRMTDIQEGEMGLVCEECAAEIESEVDVQLDTPFGSKPIKDHGSN